MNIVWARSAWPTKQERKTDDEHEKTDSVGGRSLRRNGERHRSCCRKTRGRSEDGRVSRRVDYRDERIPAARDEGASREVPAGGFLGDCGGAVVHLFRCRRVQAGGGCACEGDARSVHRRGGGQRRPGRTLHLRTQRSRHGGDGPARADAQPIVYSRGGADGQPRTISRAHERRDAAALRRAREGGEALRRGTRGRRVGARGIREVRRNGLEGIPRLPPLAGRLRPWREGGHGCRRARV